MTSQKRKSEEAQIELCRFHFGHNNPKFSDRVLNLVLKSKEETSFGTCPEGEETGDQVKKRKNNDNEGVPVKESIFIDSLLLAAHSKYFEDLMISMKKSEDLQITLPIESKEYFLSILRFIYTGQFQSNNAEDLLELCAMAHKYDIVKAFQMACKLLSEQTFTQDLCHKWLSFSHGKDLLADSEPVHRKCCEFLLEQHCFQDETDIPDSFLEFPVPVLTCLLKHNHFKAPNENWLFQALNLWLNRRKESERNSLAINLLPLLRFPLMSIGFLRDVVSHSSWIDICSELEDLIEDAKRFHLSSENRKKHMAFMESDVLVKTQMTPRTALIFSELDYESKLFNFLRKAEPFVELEEYFKLTGDDKVKFMVSGYYFYWYYDADDGGIYWELADDTGIPADVIFYLRVNYSVWAKDQLTKKWIILQNDCRIEFFDENVVQGVSKIFGCTNEELTASPQWVSNNDQIELKAKFTIVAD